MSLKAKIEAVIYASEEPVTLLQLVGLLGEEAQTELDARDAEQTTLALEMGEENPAEESNDQDALNAETLDAADVPEAADVQTDQEPNSPASAESLAAEQLSSEPEASGEPDASGSEAEPSTEEPETAEAAAADEAEVQEPAAEDSAPVALPEEEAVEIDPKVLAAETKARERRLRQYFREILDQLIGDYANGDRGLEVREVAGGFRLATKPEFHDAVRGFVKSLKPPLKLSLQALETLAVIAYKQPITAPEVGEIRGVDSGGVIGSLMTRKLVQTAGRKQVIGRPMLYKTSKEFLVRFGLRDINELPSIEEFERMAGELNEAVQEEIPMDEATELRHAAPEPEGSPVVDEIDSAPEDAAPHESVEAMLEDKQPAETHEPAESVESSRDEHEAQADGVPDETEDDLPAAE